jgi:hypothetical protein
LENLGILCKEIKNHVLYPARFSIEKLISLAIGLMNNADEKKTRGAEKSEDLKYTVIGINITIQ